VIGSRPSARSVLKRIPGAVQLVRLARTLSNPSLTDRIRSALAHRSSIFLVQVGSHDGLHGDPLYELTSQDKRWCGIMIEPVQYAFNRLKQNHGNDGRFILLNLAVSDKEEVRDFYYVAEHARHAIPDLPDWHDQLGSFSRQFIMSHLNGVLEPYIISEKLLCKPLEDILKAQNVKHIDVIQTDTEGFDFEILRQIDFLQHRPKVVLYEHKHFRGPQKTLAEAMLNQAGYRLYSYDQLGETLAIHPHW
jgi:FkbM family methyltransferase